MWIFTLNIQLYLCLVCWKGTVLVNKGRLTHFVNFDTRSLVLLVTLYTGQVILICFTVRGVTLTPHS